MFVKALERFKGQGFTVPEGAIAELPNRIAQAGIEAGKLEESTQDAYYGKETTAVESTPKRRTRIKAEKADVEET